MAEGRSSGKKYSYMSPKGGGGSVRGVPPENGEQLCSGGKKRNVIVDNRGETRTSLKRQEVGGKWEMELFFIHFGKGGREGGGEEAVRREGRRQGPKSSIANREKVVAWSSPRRSQRSTLWRGMLPEGSRKNKRGKSL